MPYDLGVDLGTTSTVAALVRDGHVSVCRLGGTSHVVPSVVSLREDGTVLTGEAADRRSVTDPSHTVREFKRRLGDDTPYVIGGTPYGAEVLTGYLLRDVAAAVAATEGEPPRRMTLTHPATWGAFKLELLADAVRIAELADAAFVPEPVAAAVAYVASNPLPIGSTLLVYDFGGGTFDAAVVQLGADGPEVIGVPEGLARLGGIDFDLSVLSHVDQAIGGAASSLDADEPEARAALARLRDDCRQAREALSTDTEAEIPVILPTVRTSVRLTRSELEALARPRLADTGAVMDRVVAGAGLSYDQLAGILLVGGTSRMPLVADFVRSHTGMVPASGIDPLLAVAFGAALLAESDGVFTTSPVASGREVVPDETTPAVSPVSAPPAGAVPPETPTEAEGARRRRRAVVVGVIVAGLVLAGTAAVALTDGGDDARARDPKDGGSDRTTKTTAGPDPESTTSTNVGDGSTGGGSNSSQNTRTGGAPATTTTTPATPYFAALRAPSSVSCAGKAPTDRIDVGVSWKTVNADSVTVAIDSPDQTWESGLPTEGSTAYTVPCDGSKTVTTAIVTARGLGNTGKTESVTIPIVF